MKKSFLLSVLLTIGHTATTFSQSFTYCNSSLILDGIDDFGSIPNQFFQNVNQRNFTIEFYLKPVGIQSQYPGVWGKTGYWSEVNIHLYVPGKVQFVYATNFSGNQYFSSDTSSYTANNWDHYAIVGDGVNNQIRIYKNGILDATTPHGTPFWDLPNNDSKIGAVYQGWTAPNTQYLKGKIDDFRVSDIVRYSTNFTPPQNLVNDINTRVLYNFNSVAGGIVPDLSGNNNNLTLQNGASLDDVDIPYENVLLSAIVTSGGPTTFCQGGSVILGASLGTGYTYEWYQNGVLISGETASSLNVSQTGNYTVQVTDGLCAATSIETVINVINCATISDLDLKKIFIYPNPAESELTIETPFTKGDIILLDVSGKIIIKSTLHSIQTKLNLKDVSPGSYVIIIKNEDNTIQRNIVVL